MKNINKLSLSINASLPSKIRLIFFVLTLVLFIIGAGAPDAGGGFVH